MERGRRDGRRGPLSVGFAATSPQGEETEPTTHAQASRQRRDLATGASMDEARLMRFVIAPDGAVTPDLGRRLPGRGLWVEATRAALTTAVRRDAFSRAAKRKVGASADLPDLVARLCAERCLAGLGLARRAGELASGFEKTAAAIAAGRAAWWIEASDGAVDGRRKLRAIGDRTRRPPPLFGVFDSHALGLALGLENAIHAAFLAGHAAERWTFEVRRLNGFSPLFPESWREDRDGAGRGIACAPSRIV